ncbi:MAG: type II secretion system protein F [Actinobacteria bacterium]|nr:type II secretion system protein F [Actinomycetota bacterium]
MGAIIGLTFAVGVLLLIGAGRPATRVARVSRLSVLITHSGLPRVTPTGVISACVACAVVIGVLILIVTAVPMAALLAAAVAGGAPLMLLRRRVRQRTAARRASWPDAVDSLVSGVRAGLALPEAVSDLGVRGPEPLRPYFLRFAGEYRATGSFTGALDALREEMADPTADRVVAALAVAWDVGGTDLGTVLRTLAVLLREDARTRGDIEARQSWTVNAARVSVAAPWVTLALLCTRPEAAAAFGTAMGAVVLGIAALVSILAYRLMMMIGRLPQERRWMIAQVA